jgi:hypothetical protein
MSGEICLELAYRQPRGLRRHRLAEALRILFRQEGFTARAFYVEQA